MSKRLTAYIILVLFDWVQIPFFLWKLSGMSMEIWSSGYDGNISTKRATGVLEVLQLANMCYNISLFNMFACVLGEQTAEEAFQWEKTHLIFFFFF